jgi:peptidoglycan/LPS O-acetylase OafA/YrhL
MCNRMTFAEIVKNRNNHFNLIRFTAAFTVLFSHSADLLGVQLPLQTTVESYGFFIGNIAVNVFFVVSGFLVTASLFNRGNIAAFFWARFLRIFPGLWVATFLIVFGLGVWATRLPVGEYLASPLTHFYLWRNFTIVSGIGRYLPGVFEANTHDQIVNASIWTIPIEWRLYEYLAMIWIVLSLVPKYRRRAFRILAPLVAVTIFGFLVSGHRDNAGAVATYLFFAGSSIFILGDKIPVVFKAVPALIAALIIAAVDPRALFVVYLLVLPLLVLNLAYAPGRVLLRFNNLGDYSYGVYIYAFPIQQTLIYLKPGISLGALMIFSSLLTLGAAILSWRLVEKPALGRKHAFATATNRFFAAVFSRLKPKARDEEKAAVAPSAE